jgi:hypothetical protein
MRVDVILQEEVVACASSLSVGTVQVSPLEVGGEGDG